MVTQKDVAELSGVSFITVSRVIRGEKNVKEETRKKVLAAIEKSGYAPGFAGQALNSGRCDTIAVLTPIQFSDESQHHYLMPIVAGIEDVCRKKNIDIMIGYAPEVGTDSHYDYLRPYRQKKVDGIIYVGMRRVPGDMLKELERRHLPCVVIGDRPDSELVSWVDTDNHQAGYNTTKKIIARGRKRILFVGLKKEIYNANVIDRERGYIDAMKEADPGFNPEKWIVRSDYDGRGASEKVKKALLSPETPDAVFCSMDSQLLQTISGIKEAGLSVPGDISLAGFDGYINEMIQDLDVATNIQPLNEIGKKAADILLRHIDDNSLPREELVLKIQFKKNSTL